MCKGLRTSIADLRRRGLSADFDRRCLVSDQTIKKDDDVFVALVSAGRAVVFRLILARMESEIGQIPRQFIIVRSSNALQRVLPIVLETGICMGQERDVRSKCFPQKVRASKPVSLNPPRRKVQMYVHIRHEEEPGLREQRIRPMWLIPAVIDGLR